MEMRRSPTITVDDLHSDVLIQILRRLDGPALANASYATSRLHNLIATNHHELWQSLCLSSWPSLRHINPSSIPNSHLSFFSDAYPFPTGNNRRSQMSITTKIISAVDIHLRDEPIFSKVVETETQSRWFLSSPFRIDAIDQKDQEQRPVVSSPDDLTLSWILIDPSTHRTVNLSSRRPVAIDRHWYTGDIQVKFAIVIGDYYVCSAVVTCGSKSGQLTAVSLTVEGGDGVCLNGEESLLELQEVLGGERKGDWKEEGPTTEVKERYWEFERKKKERKEKKVRRDGAVDLVFVLVGVFFFFGFVLRVALW